MRFIKLLIIFIFSFFTLYANEIIVDENTDKIELLSKSKIYIDHSSSLDIKAIKKQEFIDNNKSILSYGLSPKFNVWVKFTLKNNSNKKIKRVLQYGNPLSTHIEFYDEDKVYKDGLYQLNTDRLSIDPIFYLSLEAGERKTYYLKTSSKITTLIIKLNLVDSQTFEQQSYLHTMVLSMFFASMFILTIYNLFIYFFTKDRNYLLYVVYMLGMIFHQLLYSGFGSVYLFSNEFVIFTIKSAAFIVAFPLFIFALLVRSFLKVSQYPFLDKLLLLYLLIYPFTLVAFLLFDDIAHFRNITSLILLVLLLVITIYASWKRNRQAYFVLFGWVIVIFAFIFMYLSSVGILEVFEHFKYFVEIALLLEGIIFSIALADKINQLESRKNEASMELVLQKEIETIRLAHIVEQKTSELQKALDEKSLLFQELNHRVKNNMQTIVSLIRLQSDKYEDKKTIDLLQTIQNRINAMGCLHELLYKQSDISYIDTRKYFELLITELQEGFENENIKIKYEIDTNLPSEIAVYCGLIINELVTNAFKYAFNEDGEINIILKKQDDNYYLQVSDNGKGYSDQKDLKSLGTLLVQTLATKQLKGKLKKETQNGVKVEIIWS